MQNLKTGIVVALLLAVCYGAFKALNAPEPDLPPELAEWVAEDPDFDSLVDDIQVPDQAKPKFESELGLPSITVPQAELSPVIKPEANPNSHTLGGNALTLPLSVRQAADGPSTKAPSNNEITKSAEAMESLVPESFRSPQLTKPAESAPVQNTTPPLPNAANSITSDFPSIPLPSTLVSTDSQKPSPLPLLDEMPKHDSTATNSPMHAVTEPFAIGREKALKMANEGKLKEALVSLTKYYHSPEISHKDYEDLLNILDALAREVIYSPRHLLKPAYTTSTSDTLVSVAEQHKITPELLKSINQLGDTQVVIQGQQLKVLEGPFRGEVNVTIGEMTLYLNDMYACRFPVSVGTDYDSKVGKFEVGEKRTDRTYYGAGGKVVKSADPNNPYGGYWIDLGGNCIHGSPEMAATDLKNAGCISLAPIDAADAFIMLTVGSQLEFRK